jgi:uncharacterized alpha-E superfamily protein
MLSRIANSLYWMGRYLERAEHTARYTKVHYFSTLDAPLSQRKEYVLESMLRMTGLLYEFKSVHELLVDEEVLYAITLDETNMVSIKASINSARENARGARGSISSELWESINKFYHYVNNHSKSELKKTGIYNFSDKILESCAVVNGYIDNSLIHNEIWAFIHLGIRIERASQITRILISKLNDIEKNENSPIAKASENYQCITLLKSAEAFDMSRSWYQDVPNVRDTLEFLILNDDFPRAICYNLTRISKFLRKITDTNSEKDSLNFSINKITTYYKYLTIDEIEKDISGFLYNTLENINNISEMLSRKYLNY